LNPKHPKGGNCERNMRAEHRRRLHRYLDVPRRGSGRRCGESGTIVYPLALTFGTLHPAHYTLQPAPYALNPTPCTLHPTHPTPFTLYLAPYTLNSQPYTIYPTPCTPHLTPHTLHYIPYTLHPQFQNPNLKP